MERRDFYFVLLTLILFIFFSSFNHYKNCERDIEIAKLDYKTNAEAIIMISGKINMLTEKLVQEHESSLDAVLSIHNKTVDFYSKRNK
jgi:hypothetical protein